MYFSSFPVIPYTLDNGETWNLMRDITIRTRIIEENFSQVGLYTYYAVNEGATPEDIAAEVYGTPYLHWVILLVNDIIDPVMEWPWTEERVRDYTFSKYKRDVLWLRDFITPDGFFAVGSALTQKNPTTGEIITAKLTRITSSQGKALYYTDRIGFVPTPVKMDNNGLPNGYDQDYFVYIENTNNRARIAGVVDPDKQWVWNSVHHVESAEGIIKQEYTGGSDREITNLEFEMLRNEKNREIRILRPEYIGRFIREFKRLVDE
jgi:hypothetical protein